MSMNQVRDQRRILLAVTGLTAQVITETLYALCCRHEQPWIPHEVHLITTAIGAENARLNLLKDSTGWFHRLRRDYELPPIAFTEQYIHVLKGSSGAALDDIRTPEQNSIAADAITEIVRLLTADENTAVHASIAGGRKTMGYYLGYALSLFGRPQDRMSHVLVSEPFEGSRDFYYPTPYDHPVHIRRGDVDVAYNANNAIVELAEIPFVTLRHGLPEALLSGNATFQQTVDIVNANLGPLSLFLDLKSRWVRVGQQQIQLPETLFSILAVLAYRAQRGLGPMSAPMREAPDPEWSCAFLGELQQVFGSGGVSPRLEDALLKGVDGNWLSPNVTRLRQRLRAVLGPATTLYFADNERGKHALRLPPGAITFGTLNPSC